jgi:hypothetical protein
MCEQCKRMNAPKWRKFWLEEDGLKDRGTLLLITLIEEVSCKAHLLNRGQRHDGQANDLFLW